MSRMCSIFGHHYNEDFICKRCGSVPDRMAEAFHVFGGPEALNEYIMEYERERKGSIYGTTFVFSAEGHPDDRRDLFAINATSYQDAMDIVEQRRPAGVKVHYIGELNEMTDRSELDLLTLQRAGYAFGEEE